MTGKLYIVSTPIGNLDDITFRALRILNECDYIVCEEFNVGKKLLNHYQIKKELFPLNEHNEIKESDYLLTELLNGKNLALVSDCGTPAFSDPGSKLIRKVISSGIPLEPIPGTDSLMPSLILSGFDVSNFYYAGWLSPKREVRTEELKNLVNIKNVIAIMETPYRLKALLTNILEVFSGEIEICLATNLTTDKEYFFRGKLKNILDQIQVVDEKFEFVIIINNR